MSRVSLAFLLLAGMAAGPVHAADLFGAPQPGVPTYGSASPIANWSGAYLGVQLGYGWNRQRISTNAGSATGEPERGSLGVFGGLMTPLAANFILGAEVDVNYADIKTTRAIGPRSYSSQTDFNGSVRGRLGVAFDRFMPYGTAGLAFANTKYSALGVGSSSFLEFGWALGTGVEAQVMPNLNVRLEYLHQNFDGDSKTIGSVPVKSELTSNQLRAGVGFKF